MPQYRASGNYNPVTQDAGGSYQASSTRGESRDLMWFILIIIGILIVVAWYFWSQVSSFLSNLTQPAADAVKGISNLVSTGEAAAAGAGQATAGAIKTVLQGDQAIITGAGSAVNGVVTTASTALASVTQTANAGFDEAGVIGGSIVAAASNDAGGIESGIGGLVGNAGATSKEAGIAIAGIVGSVPADISQEGDQIYQFGDNMLAQVNGGLQQDEQFALGGVSAIQDTIKSGLGWI
jgi:hypothetical protein